MSRHTSHQSHRINNNNMDRRKSIKPCYGYLIVKKDNGDVFERFPVTKEECTLGRDTKCDISILLEKVSALQCIIISVDNKAYVRDKSVAGSTKVNGKKVGKNNFLLHDSDEIEICERKFVWKYPKKPHGELINLSCKKSRIRSDHLSPRPPERFPNQVTTPLDKDNSKKVSTTAYSSIKTPSKTILSLNKTPIIITTENMSKSSFDEVQNSFQNQSSTTTAQAESDIMKSYSMTPVRNIPLLGNYKTTQRKSWIVTNTSDNSSSIGSPDTPGFLLNSENDDINTTDIADNIFPVDNQSDLNYKDDDTLQFNKNEINQLSVSEPGTSRRDTYSVDSRPIVIEENTTPTPRRSILKSSKTTKPNRSRSSRRMVQFDRLPKRDSKIKNTKTRLNPGFNFIVSNDENNVVDLNLDNLDNSIIKSSKRGSRGDKVMSLVNSIEKRSNESSKHSIRASDLLSMNGSKHVETSPNDDSQNNANLLQESVSSTRRINLKDIFEAKDSLIPTSNIENETLAQEIKKSLVKNVEIVSSPKTNSLNITVTEKIPGNVFTEDVSKNDTNDLECEYTFALPLILPKIDSSSIAVIDNDSAFVDSENDFSPTEIIDNQFDKNSKLDISSHIIEDCTSPNELITKTDNVERPSLDHELSTTSTHDDNIDETQRDKSDCYEKTVDEEICTDDIEIPNNITELSEKYKPIEKEHTQKENEDSEFANDDECTNEVQPSKNDVTSLIQLLTKTDNVERPSLDHELSTTSTHDDNIDETQRDKSDCYEKTVDEEICTDDIEIPNNITELSEKYKPIEKEHTQKENEDSEFANDDECTNEVQPSKNDVTSPIQLLTKTDNVERPSLDHELSTTSTHDDNIDETQRDKSDCYEKTVDEEICTDDIEIPNNITELSEKYKPIEKEHTQKENEDSEFANDDECTNEVQPSKNDVTSPIQLLTKTDNVERPSLDHELSTTSTHDDNIDETQRDKSDCYEKTVDEEICTDDIEIPNNITELSEKYKPIEKEHTQKENEDSEFANDDECTNEVQPSKNDVTSPIQLLTKTDNVERPSLDHELSTTSTHDDNIDETLRDKSDCYEKTVDEEICTDDIETPNNITELSEKYKPIEKEHTQKENEDSEFANDDECTNEVQPSKNDVTSPIQLLTKTDNVERPSLDHELSTTSTHDDNIDETQRDKSDCYEKTVDEEICTDDIETPNNITELTEKYKPIEKEHTQKENDDSEFANDDECTNEVQPSKNDVTSPIQLLTKTDNVERPSLDHELSTTSTHDDNIDETQRDKSDCYEKTVDEEICTDDIETPNNITELSEKYKPIEKEHTQKENDDSEFANDDECTNEVQPSKNDVTSPIQLLTKTDNVERPSLDHELSTTSTHDDNIDETQRDKSDCYEKTVDEEICTDDIEIPNNITELSEKYKPIEKEHTQKENDDSEFVNDDECTNEVQPSKNDVVRLVNKSTDLNLDQIDKQNYVSKVVEQTLNGEIPSIVVQSMPEMFNASIDEHETAHSQHKENLVETYVLMGKDDLQNPLGVKEFEKINLDKCNNTLCENSVLSAETVNKSLMDAIEVQLDKKYSECDASSNCNENEIIPVDSTLDLNKQKTITSNLDLEVTENLTLKLNDNPSYSSLNTLTVVGSPEIISKPKSPTKDNLSNNCLTDVDCSNVTELPARTSVGETNSVQNIDVNNEDSNITIPPDNLSVENKSPKPFRKKLINIDQLRTALGTNISNKLKKSVRTPIIESIGHKHRKIDSTKRITEFCLSSSSDDENDTTKKNLDHSLDTSIGKLRFKSTPWNCSQSSKTPINSTASIQTNETIRDDSAENEDRPKNESRSRSATPFDSQKEWSQKMRKFNKSVKKAPVNIKTKIKNTSNRKKIFFATTLKLFEVSAHIPTKDSNMKNNTSEIKNNNSTQRLIKPSSMSSNTSYESGHFKRFMRNKSASAKIVRRSSRSNKSQTSHVDNCSSAETCDDNKISPSSTNEIQTFKRELPRRKHINTSFIKTRKNTLNTDKIKTTEKSKKKNTSSTKKYSTKTNNALSESGVINLDKKNKNVAKSKSTKISKTVKTKKRTNLRTNMNSRPKRLLLSKPIKTTKESTQKLQSVDHPSKSIKEKTQKKNVDDDINLSSLPTRRSQREKLKLSDVSLQSGRQIRKRAANKSPLTQSSQDKKKDILPKVLANPISRASNSPKKANNIVTKQNSAVSNLVPDDSFPDTTKKSAGLKSKKNSQLNRLLHLKPIKINIKDYYEYGFLTDTEESTQKPQSIHCPPKSTKEKTKKTDVNVDNNLSSTERKLREKSKTSDVSLLPPKTQSRKRAADSSPLSQPNAKGKKCEISSIVANTVSRASNSQNIRTRNMSKLTVKQDSDNSFPETTIVIKKERKKSIEKVKPKSNENTRTKKRQLNSDNYCSFDSAPSTSKKSRRVTFRGIQSENKKFDSSTCITSKIQNTDDSIGPNASLKVKYNKNAEKSILPIQRITRNAAKQASPKDKETFISPRVLRVRDKKK